MLGTRLTSVMPNTGLLHRKNIFGRAEPPLVNLDDEGGYNDHERLF